MEFLREAGPAELRGEVTGVVEEEERRGAVGRVSDDGQGGVGVVDAQPSPLRRGEGGSDEPADEEVVGDDEFVARLVAGDGAGELRERRRRERGSLLALLSRELIQELDPGIGCLWGEFFACRQVGNVVAGRAGAS